MVPATRALPGALFAVVLTLAACSGATSPTRTSSSGAPPASKSTAIAPVQTAAITAAPTTAPAAATTTPSAAMTKPSGAAASTPLNSTFTSAVFAVPVSFTLPGGWTVFENKHSVIDLRGPDLSAGPFTGQDIGIQDIASTTVAGPTKNDLPVPWPKDLYEWLKSRPEFSTQVPETIMVGGRPATQIVADASVPDGTRIELVCPKESGCWLLDNSDPWSRWRFVEVKNDDGSGVVWITNGLPAPGFDAFAQTLDQLLGTFQFR